MTMLIVIAEGKATWHGLQASTYDSLDYVAVDMDIMLHFVFQLYSYITPGYCCFRCFHIIQKAVAQEPLTPVLILVSDITNVSSFSLDHYGDYQRSVSWC
jgi:hypothetical protein